MTKFYLVTSSIDETIPNNSNIPLLLLGENCFSNNRVEKKIHSKKFRLETYHWNDREKMSRDLDYIWVTSNKLIDALSEKLNEIHETNFSKNYWELFIGQKILRLTTYLFDKWECLNKAINNNDIYKVLIAKNNKSQLNARDNLELDSLMHDSEYWNHLIYSYIIENYTNLDFEFIIPENIKYNSNLKKFNNSRKKSISNKFYKIIKNPIILFNYFESKIEDILKKNRSNIPIKKNEVYFHSNIFYSEKYQNYFLKKINQTPRSINFNNDKVFIPDYDKNIREKLIKNINFNVNSKFEKFLIDIISRVLPRSYIEGYKVLRKINLKNNLLTNLPKAIMIRSHQSGSNLLGLEWIASCKDRGSRLLILQTGGGWQNSKKHLLEKFDIKISDRYFSYGKINEDKKKIFSVGFSRNFQEKLTKPNFKNGNIIITLFTPFGYNSEPSCRRPVGPQWKKYIDDQISLLKLMPDKVKNKIILRLKKRHKEDSPYFDYWSMIKKITKNFPNIKIDSNHSTKKLLDHVPNSRLIVATYNASVILETLSLNVPTIMYWNKNYNEINDLSKFIFDKMQEVGILHYNAQSAAKHIVKNFENLEDWWNSQSVQNVRKEFCLSFADLPANRISKFNQNLNNL